MTTPRVHRQPPLTRKHFVRHLAPYAGYGALVVVGSAAFGTIGYRFFAGYRWIDAFLNACMLLGGMGPVGELPNDGAKLFASFFALYSGLVFLVLAGLVLAPVFHRVLHRFHWEAAEKD
jgi:hypothetical protein